MVTGRVLQFDHARGYGFVAADDGGDDVFLHTSVFDGDPGELVPGTKMEFKVMAGDRGRKAFAARLADEPPEEDRVSPPQPASTSRLVPGPRPAPAFPPAPSPVPVPATPAAPPSSRPAPHDQGKDQAPDDEQLCDVLSSAEFGQELTELLLSSVPSLTGAQVLQVRRIALESARKHGWVDM